VHYRYGGFDGRFIQLAYGEIVGAISDPRGQLIPDERGTSFSPPAWVSDPFVESGIAAPSSQSNEVIDERILLISILHRSPRGNVHLALDLQNLRRCIVKRGNRGAAVARDGRDARDQLRNEYEVLSKFRGDRRYPRPYELVERGAETLLLMEDIPGETLESYVASLRSSGRFVDGATVAKWGYELAVALGCLHGHKLIYRDCKPNNIILTPRGRLRILDLELAHDTTSPLPPLGLGTHGYMSPQQAAGASPVMADDIYALGAVLYFISTGANPAQTPQAICMDRPIRLLNPAIGAPLEGIVRRCVDPDPTRRYSSMQQVAHAIRCVAKSSGGARYVPPISHRAEQSLRRHWRALAQELGETLVDFVRLAHVEPSSAWIANPEEGNAFFYRDINSGMSGVVLALSELVTHFGSARTRNALLLASRRLMDAPTLPGAVVPGLYVGEAGIAAALLRAGQALGNRKILAAAGEHARRVGNMEHASPDLFNGTAGRIRMHLLVWEEFRDDRQLTAAIEGGEFLLSCAQTQKGHDDERGWEIPEGFGPHSRQVYLGYAHGAAGIGDSLLDLYEASGDSRFLAAARGAARWLARLTLPALDDGTGAEWPDVEGGTPAGAMWCHGATGIGRFMAHAGHRVLIPNASELAVRAALTVAHGARTLGPVQCHGLAGNIEFLIDLFQITGKRRFLAQAFLLGRLLPAFAVRQHGMLKWCSDRASIVAPGYMTGYSGVLACLLRLSKPYKRKLGVRLH
jgi:serine/threonine protein kinase